MDEKKAPETIEELKTLKDFKKEIPAEVKELWVHDRFNNILSRGELPEIIKKYSKFKVLNYFEKEKGIWDIFVIE